MNGFLMNFRSHFTAIQHPLSLKTEDGLRLREEQIQPHLPKDASRFPEDEDRLTVSMSYTNDLLSR